MKKSSKKIIVAISGSSGSIYGIKLLEMLRSMGIESHLIISNAAKITISHETNYSFQVVKDMASHSYNQLDMCAPISSGSFRTDGMIVAPCSMKTLSGIANSYEDNLVIRAASVVMKEQKKLALMVRETPLHSIHLENMLKLSSLGVAIVPPVPSFYNNHKTLDEVITQSLARVLDLFDIEFSLIKRWSGIKNNSKR